MKCLVRIVPLNMKPCYHKAMGIFKKYMAVCMMFSLVLAAMPYGGFIPCAHAAGTAQEKSADDAEPPCPMHAKAEAQTEKPAQSKMDCCGDFCTCALGNCHAAPAVLSVKHLQGVPFSAASLNIAGLDIPAPFSPELPTPPPKA